MEMPKKKKRWTRAVPLIRPNQIISSEFTHYQPFVPSYEKEPISMFKLLGMDYAREWRQEKDRRKEIVVVSNEAAFLQRRYVIRGLLRKLHQAHQPESRFIMKKFKNVKSKFKDHLKEEEKKPQSKNVDVGIPRKKSAQVQCNLKPVRQLSAEALKRRAMKEEEMDACSEDTTILSKDTSYFDLTEVCKEDKKKCAKDSCQVGEDKINKATKKQSDDAKSETKSRAKSEKPTSIPAQPSQPKVDEKRVQTPLKKSEAKGQYPSKSEGICVCQCTCACESFDKGKKFDNLSGTSSTLSGERDSLGDSPFDPKSMNACKVHPKK